MASWVLVRMRDDRYGGKRTNWLLIKHLEDAACKNPATPVTCSRRIGPSASGRTMQQIADSAGKRPKAFMLAAGRPAPADAPCGTPNPEPGPPLLRREPVLAAKIPSFVEPQLAKS